MYWQMFWVKLQLRSWIKYYRNDSAWSYSIFDVCLEAALNMNAYDIEEGSEIESNFCDGLGDRHAERRDEDVLYCFNCITGRIESCMWL